MSDRPVYSRLRPCPGVVFKPVEGESVLLDSRSGMYFSLNETSTVLWKALDPGPASLADLEAALVGFFGEVPATLRADLEAWVLEMKQHDLLELIG